MTIVSRETSFVQVWTVVLSEYVTGPLGWVLRDAEEIKG